MTTSQINKVKVAISETEAMLNNALRYSQDLQDKNLVDYCKNHLVKLNNMIA